MLETHGKRIRKSHQTLQKHLGIMSETQWKHRCNYVRNPLETHTKVTSNITETPRNYVRNPLEMHTKGTLNTLETLPKLAIN